MADIQALQQLLAGRGGAGLSQLMGMGLPRPAAGTAARANTSGAQVRIFLTARAPGAGPARSLAGLPKHVPPPAQAWTGLRDFDEVTMAELGKLLERLKARGVKELRVLLLGKPGVGKTSTMNSILNENASAVAAFRGMPNEVEVVSRYSNGFTLMFLDTPGLTSQDGVSTAALQAITEELEGNPVDIGGPRLAPAIAAASGATSPHAPPPRRPQCSTWIAWTRIAPTPWTWPWCGPSRTRSGAKCGTTQLSPSPTRAWRGSQVRAPARAGWQLVTALQRATSLPPRRIPQVASLGTSSWSAGPARSRT